MDYTIDVLNSDVGLITASRTTEQIQAALSADNDEEKSTFGMILLPLIAIVAVVMILGKAFGGDDDDGDTIDLGLGGGGDKDSGPDGPRIYRYKVTVNLNDIDTNNTKVRVSASGEIEQDGKILSTGGIHELEFFQQFFANVNKALFLEDQGQ